MKTLFDLFITFFKIGLFTFGGGYSMIAFIENECVNKKHWINNEDMKEVIIISESTPGPIAINVSTFVGYRVNKILGSIISTIAISLPSLIIITLISIFLAEFKESLFINLLLEGVRASVIFLILLAFLNLSKNIKKNMLFYAILALTFILNFIFSVKSIYIIIFTIILSILYQIFSKKQKREEINNA